MDERPMLATASTGQRAVPIEDLLAKRWVADTKLDGVRCFGRNGRLINRNGVKINDRYPEVEVPTGHWFDGEIVAVDGTFETTLLRDQQVNPARIKRLAETHPCRFVAFDLLDRAEEGHPYNTRRIDLERVAAVTGVTTTPIGDDLLFVKGVKDLGMEGVIMKRPGSRYRFGVRSTDWVKYKNVHRISMVAVGYEPGTGHRSHFGSLKLALVAPDGHPVTGPEDSPWRVGSGFKIPETYKLKDRLDAGELLVVEVEVLNRTSEGALRFPVYRGIRQDVEPIDCTLGQLDAVPTC
jgi:bifunctional non-homologous end joining protein LigD